MALSASFLRRFMTVPTVIIYCVMIPFLVVAAQQTTRVYTVTCMDGSCGTEASLTAAVQDRVKTAVGGASGTGGPRSKVSLEDFTRFTQTAAQKNAPLTCPCSKANVEFGTFSNVKPQQINMCTRVLDLFYGPMSDKATTAKV